MNTTKKHSEIATKGERLFLKNRKLRKEINLREYQYKVRSRNKEGHHSYQPLAEKELTEYPKGCVTNDFFYKR